MNGIICTSYVDPDLDGVACAVAYAEFLNATGSPALACIMGNPTAEAEYTLERFSVPRPVQRPKMEPGERVVILDASEPIHFEDRLALGQVIEVIDHRKVHEAHRFPNAKAQIELVGAAATLVAERFQAANVQPSKISALLLQAAIISNTQNFLVKTTTERDQVMMEWLGIVQLEVVGSGALLQNRKSEMLEILKRLQSQNRLDLIFVTMLDVEEKLNRFLAPDSVMQDVLTKALELKFTDDVAMRDGIIMRKEIVPLVKQVMEKKS